MTLSDKAKSRIAELEYDLIMSDHLYGPGGRYQLSQELDLLSELFYKYECMCSKTAKLESLLEAYEYDEI